MTYILNDRDCLDVHCDRRSFVKQAAGACVGTGAALLSLRPTAEATGPSRESEPFVGIQIAPHSFYDEGIDFCLDQLREAGRVNALMISSLSYYGAMGRPKRLMADHGVPIRDNANRKLPRVWVRHREKYYKDTSLRHMKRDPAWEYASKDVFTDLAEPAHKRGIKLYERMYEPSSKAASSIANLTMVLETDIFGKRGSRPCVNNPDYRAWLVATIHDLFENYDLDGIQYGAERSGPLSEWLSSGTVPRCFCSYCTAKAKEAGLDVDEACEGLSVIHKYISALKEGANPTDGVLTELLRILMKYPEVLAWELQWSRSLNDLHQLLYGTIKAIKRDACVGRHVDHQQSTYSLLFRAAADYSGMADSNDFIKLILYHDIAGPRVLDKIQELRNHVLRELTTGQSLDLYYALFGYDPKVEAAADELAGKGLSPDYVYRETKRAVEGIKGGSAIYAGIGMDIPKGGGWGTDKWQSDPESVFTATRKSFEAGGKGVVASREYEEITLDSLRAMGRAIDEISKSRS